MRINAPAPRRPFETIIALVNIVFVLLLFLLATGTIVYRDDASIEPPTSLLLTTGKPPVDAVYVSPEGALSFRGQMNDAAGIARAIRAERDRLPDSVVRPVQLVADRRLNARALLRILAELKAQGVRDIAVVTVKDHAS